MRREEDQVDISDEEMSIAAKAISDDQIMGALAATRGRHGVPHWSSLWDVQSEMPQYPPKVVLAKLASLIRRNVISGCDCGCRGDFELLAPPPPNTPQPAPKPSWDRAALESMQCMEPGCEHDGHGPLVLSGRCHPKSTQVVRYFGDGMVELVCKMCSSFVCRVAIAHSSIEHLQPQLGNATDALEANHLEFRNVCHDGVGLYVVYADRRLLVMCGKCQAIIRSIDVKDASVSA